MSTPTRVSTTPLQTQGIALALVMTALALVGRSASAATATTTLNVSATVAQDCSITTTPWRSGTTCPPPPTASQPSPAPRPSPSPVLQERPREARTDPRSASTWEAMPLVRREICNATLERRYSPMNCINPMTILPALAVQRSVREQFGNHRLQLVHDHHPQRADGSHLHHLRCGPPGQDKPAGNYTDVVNATVNF